ncbi:GntR family transcriptional regulator [Actinomadura chibensis]|uniref:GntR family transcriptional regulator n=1 Tax=Actinomadura chibensis TaxID=392828 RepID=A0A5D0NI22_9ACTN|nr:GntR family transcriptional regulator [Actinomadura chibensis]TYB44086.1 GntR family transcriptional regulator [Actinomadura chibensis]
MAKSTSDTGSVRWAVSRIREMITVMELLPGQQIRQEDMASRLNVSRAPIREALGILQSEGVLDYQRNVGYSVKRLTVQDLEQAYLMRRVLEREVINALPELSAAQLDELAEINGRIKEAGDVADVLTIQQLNNEFHFFVFRASGLDLIVDELRRIWSLTEAYRSVYLYEAEARKRIVEEHAAIVEALRRGDRAAVVELSDQHRSRVPSRLAAVFSTE